MFRFQRFLRSRRAELQRRASPPVRARLVPPLQGDPASGQAPMEAHSVAWRSLPAHLYRLQQTRCHHQAPASARRYSTLVAQRVQARAGSPLRFDCLGEWWRRRRASAAAMSSLRASDLRRMSLPSTRRGHSQPSSASACWQEERLLQRRLSVSVSWFSSACRPHPKDTSICAWCLFRADITTALRPGSQASARRDSRLQEHFQRRVRRPARQPPWT